MSCMIIIVEGKLCISRKGTLQLKVEMNHMHHNS